MREKEKWDFLFSVYFLPPFLLLRRNKERKRSFSFSFQPLFPVKRKGKRKEMRGFLYPFSFFSFFREKERTKKRQAGCRGKSSTNNRACLLYVYIISENKQKVKEFSEFSDFFSDLKFFFFLSLPFSSFIFLSFLRKEDRKRNRKSSRRSSKEIMLCCGDWLDMIFPNFPNICSFICFHRFCRNINRFKRRTTFKLMFSGIYCWRVNSQHCYCF